MLYQVKLTEHVSNIGKSLTPEIRQAAKAALKKLAANPSIGKALQRELQGFWSYRFARYRIVYRIDTEQQRIIVWAIAHRSDIYETLSDYLIQSTG